MGADGSKAKATKPKAAADLPKKKAKPKPKPKPKPEKKPVASETPKSKRRWWLLAAILLILTLIFPFAEVAFVRYYPPPVTTLMVFRKIEGYFSTQYQGKIEYRWIAIDQAPPDFVKAVWVAEDERFFQHEGIDWKEVALAQDEAERTGKPARGASTISMQCARTVFLWQGRSYIRKGLEAIYTILMEKMLPKKRILELYINTVELGDGVYGVEAAAQRYFKKSARKLTRSECAMLAAMLPYPRGWNPLDPSPRLRGRHQMILRKMRTTRFPVEKLTEK